MLEQQRLRSDTANAARAEEFREGDKQVGRQEEQIAHASNIITPVIARKTARQRLIRTRFTIYEFATYSITNGKIARISAEPLAGERVLNAKGLVVAPGFIDLHQHGQDVDSGRVKVFDGVTTALEMEIGSPDVAAFLKSKQGQSLVNYGSSASHVAARALIFGAPLPEGTLLPAAGPATDLPATAEQIQKIEDRLRHELDAGGLGVGMGIQYTPGASRLEVIQMFRLAAERSVPVFVHVRSAGRVEPGSSIEAVSEVIGAAAVSGASLHIVHINSMCTKDSLECLSMVAGARARGLDVTAEAYPYTAGMTFIRIEQS